MRDKLMAMLVAGLAWCMVAPACADTYPSRSITMIVPFAAGSGTDMVARTVGEKLSKRLGVAVVVENRPGANGIIAASAAAKANPDGYTIFMTTNTSHSAVPAMVKNVPYDPIKDFAPITRVGNLPFMFVTAATTPAATLQEFIALAKKNPGKLSYGFGNSTGQVGGALLVKRAGISMTGIAYKSTPPALIDVVGGHIALTIIDQPAAAGQIKAGSVRPLAVLTHEREKLLPQIPSMRESGVKDFDIISWNGIFAPAATPKPVIELLNRELRKVIDDPQTRATLANAGFDAFSSTPEEFAVFVREQLTKWRDLVRESGATMD